jgi:hypothetical protein
MELISLAQDMVSRAPRHPSGYRQGWQEKYWRHTLLPRAPSFTRISLNCRAAPKATHTLPNLPSVAWSRLFGSTPRIEEFKTTTKRFFLRPYGIYWFQIKFSLQKLDILYLNTSNEATPLLMIVHIIIIIIIIISCHRFSFFPGTSPLEPVVNPTTQASSLSS